MLNTPYIPINQICIKFEERRACGEQVRKKTSKITQSAKYIKFSEQFFNYWKRNECVSIGPRFLGDTFLLSDFVAQWERHYSDDRIPTDAVFCRCTFHIYFVEQKLFYRLFWDDKKFLFRFIFSEFSLSGTFFRYHQITKWQFIRENSKGRFIREITKGQFIREISKERFIKEITKGLNINFYLECESTVTQSTALCSLSA